MRRLAAIASAASIPCFMLVCRSSAAFSSAWQRAVSLPVLSALHRLSGLTAAPVLEIAAILLPMLTLCAIAIRRPRLVALLLLIVAGGYALMWYPAYWAASAEAGPIPDSAQLERLCAGLVDRLGRDASEPLSPDDTAAQAGGVAGMPHARVKLARRAAWMRALSISGLFSPWTGEIIVDPTAPPGLVPFTAVHELMHLKGVADEGSANIAAWQYCMARGGAFAASARMWALKYALNALNRIDPSACLRVMNTVDDAMRALCRPTQTSPVHPPLGRLCSALGIREASASYDALVGWLAAQN